MKRLNYFKNQFLKVEDFKDEQQYHIDKLGYHNKYLHTVGIAGGLDVEFKPGGNYVTVTRGVAVDGNGREIILEDEKQIDFSQSEVGSYFLTISYEDTETDPTEETGVVGNTRITEIPKFEYKGEFPEDPSIQIILAKVTVMTDEGGDFKVKDVDDSVRRYAGIKAADLETKSIGISLPAITEDKWPKIKGTVTDEDKGGISVKSDMTIFYG